MVEPALAELGIHWGFGFDSSRGLENLAVFSGVSPLSFGDLFNFCSKLSSENGKWEKPAESRDLRAGQCWAVFP